MFKKNKNLFHKNLIFLTNDELNIIFKTFDAKNFIFN